jgi:hypothetical protein
MASRYSVIQYLPDPLSDERINVGVVAFDDKAVFSRFIRNWRRVSAFSSGADITFLQEFARRFDVKDARQLVLEGVESPAITGETVEAASRSWINSIQFSIPRASTRPAEDLVDDIAKRFLREYAPTPRHKRGRDRRAAAAIAAHEIEAALKGAGGKHAEGLLKRRIKVQGKLDEHELDVGIANGRLLLGVLGLSFEAGSSREVMKELSAVAWAIDDVHESDPALDMAVVILPPKSRAGKTYDRAIHVIEGLNAQPVPEEEVHKWAPRAAEHALGRTAAHV